MSGFETREDAREWMVEQIPVNLRDKDIHISERHIDDVMKVGPDMARISCRVDDLDYDYHVVLYNRMETPGEAFDNLAGGEAKIGVKLGTKDGFSGFASGEANLTVAQFNVDEGGISPGATFNAAGFVEFDAAKSGDDFSGELKVDLKKVTAEGSVTYDSKGMQQAEGSLGVDVVPYIVQPNVGAGMERVDDLNHLDVTIGLYSGTYGTQSGEAGFARVGDFQDHSQSIRETYNLLEMHHPDAIEGMSRDDFNDHIKGLVEQDGFPNQEAIFRTVVDMVDPAADVRREGATQEDTRDFIRGDYVKTDRTICYIPFEGHIVNWPHETAEQAKFDGDPEIKSLHEARLGEEAEARSLGYDLNNPTQSVSLEQARGYAEAQEQYAVIGQGPDSHIAITPEDLALENSEDFARVAIPLDNMRKGIENDPMEMRDMWETFRDPQIGQSVIGLADQRFPEEMGELRTEAAERVRQQEFLKQYEREQSMRPNAGMPIEMDPTQRMMNGPSMGGLSGMGGL